MPLEHAVSDSQANNNPASGATDATSTAHKLQADAWPQHIDSTASPAGKDASAAASQGGYIKEFGTPTITDSQTQLTDADQKGLDGAMGGNLNSGKSTDQAEIDRTRAEAKDDYLNSLKPDHLPKIDIDGDPNSASGKNLKNGDTIQTTSQDQTLSRPDGEKLTVKADGSYEIDFKKTGKLAAGDGKAEPFGDGVRRIHLGDQKNGENVLIDDKGIIAISNPYGTVAVRGKS